MYLGSQLWGQNTCCTKFQLPLIISGPQCQTCKKHKKVDLYATIPALMFSLLREGFVRDPLFSECSPSKPEVTQWFSNGSEPQNHLEGLSNTGPALLLQQDKGAVRICISNNSWVLLLYGPAPLWEVRMKPILKWFGPNCHSIREILNAAPSNSL